MPMGVVYVSGCGLYQGVWFVSVGVVCGNGFGWCRWVWFILFDSDLLPSGCPKRLFIMNR